MRKVQRIKRGHAGEWLEKFSWGGQGDPLRREEI